MKHMKKLVALALVVMSVMAVAIPAMATEVWEGRYSDREIYTNTPAGYSWAIRNVQRDLNTYFQNIPAYQLTVDGYFGQLSKASVKEFQRRNGLTQDGRVGPNTKDFLWAVYNDVLVPPAN